MLSVILLHEIVLWHSLYGKLCNAFVGEKILELKSEIVCGEILINPCCHSTVRSIRSFLSAQCIYRFLLHAGLVFEETGNWILQDSPLSFHAFSSLFHSCPCNGTGPVDIVVSPRGDWNSKNLHCLVSGSRVRLPPKPDEITEHQVADFWKLAQQISHHLEPRSVVENLPATEVIGSMTFTRPTIYIFPGGQGVSSLFCINNCNVLVDGGFSRQCCFWSLAHHMETIDALMITSLSEENILGMAAFLERKVLGDIYPKIGPVFINARSTAKDGASAAKATGSSDELCVNFAEESSAVLQRLQQLNYQPYQCVMPSDRSHSYNIFNRLGYGSLDLYVLSPAAECKEWKDFVHRKSAGFVSICAVVVFQPADPRVHPTRVLYCGSTSQQKIFSGCDHFKTLQLFQTVSGLPKEKPMRPSSISASSLAPTSSRPRATSTGAASSGVKKSIDIHVKEQTSRAAAVAAVPKSVSKESLKITHCVDTSKKLMSKSEHGIKPQSSTRQPVAARQLVKPGQGGSKSLHDVKGSTTARGATAKPSGSKSVIETRPVVSTKSKRTDVAGRLEPEAKRGSEPQMTMVKAAIETQGDVDTTNVEEMLPTADESSTDEHRVITDSGNDQGQADMSVAASSKSGSSNLPAEMVALLQDAEVLTEQGQLDTETAAKPDGVSSEALTSKPETLDDRSEKDIDTVEAALGNLSSEVGGERLMAGDSQDKSRCDEVAVAGEESLQMVSDLPVSKEKEINSDSMTFRDGMEQSSASEKDDVATCSTLEVVSLLSDLPVNKDEEVSSDGVEQSQSSASVKDDVTLSQSSEVEGAGDGVGLVVHDVEPAAIKVTDESVEFCGINGTVQQSETVDLKGTESTVTIVVSDDAANTDHHSASDVGESVMERTGTVDERSMLQNVGETEQDMDSKVQAPTDGMSGAEEHTLTDAKDNTETVDNYPSSCEKPPEEIFQDGVASDSVRDCMEQSQSSACMKDGVVTLSQSSEVEGAGAADLGLVVHDVEPEPMKVTNESCAVNGTACQSATIDLKDTLESVVTTAVTDDAENAEHHSASGVGESVMERTGAVDEHGLLQKVDETEQDVESKVQVPTDGMSGAEEHTLTDAKDNIETVHNYPSSCEKLPEEMSLDSVASEGSSDLVEDSSKQSGKLEDDAAGKHAGEGSTVDSSGGVDPEHEWEAPQHLPAPLGDKDEKSTSSTKSSAVAGSSKQFKVPAARPKKAAGHRDDFGITNVAGASKTTDSGRQGRLSLQPGELRMLSTTGPQKTLTTSAKSVVPFYVDLVSLPISAAGTRAIDVDFFRRIRARYYVVNAAELDSQVIELLAEAKATWEGPVEPATVIPTGNSQSLLEWCSTNEERMTALQISVCPSASRCSVQLQGNNCSAYRLEL